MQLDTNPVMIFQLHWILGDVEQVGVHTGDSALGRVNGKVSPWQPRSF